MTVRDPRVNSFSFATGVEATRQVKRYRPIPDSPTDPEAILETVDALKETVEIMARVRGYTDDSFVTLGELAQVIGELKLRLDAIEATVADHEARITVLEP